MEFRNLTTFMRVAELQSFTKAAEQLGYSQSAVTVQIRQLEQELGVPLFERIGKKVKLTESGNRFFVSSLDILRAVASAKTTIGNHEQAVGRLRIGTAESLLISILPPILTEFGRQCPNVEISIHTGTISELFNMVKHNDVDLLFFLDQKTYFSEWIKIIECPESIVFVSSAGHPLANQKNIRIEQLIKEPLLLTEKSISYRYILEQELASSGFEMHPFLETGNTDVITKMLLYNIGISFLPKYVIKEYIDTGALCILDVDFPKTEMWVQLIHHKYKWITPQMKIFMEYMKKAMENW